MNKLVRLSLMSAVVNNIYSGCGNCCCCNKKSNNNNWSGTSGNDKPNDKPEEKPKPDGKPNSPVDENTKTLEEPKPKEQTKPTLTIEVDSESGTITINNEEIYKLDADVIIDKNFLNIDSVDELIGVNCHPLTEEQYKTVNGSNVDLTNLHKEDDKFITYTIKKGDECFLVDVNIDGYKKAPELNNGIDALNIVRSKNIINGEKLFYADLGAINGLFNIDTSTFTSMEKMFQYVSAKELDLSYFKTKNVTTMRYMFYSCSDLQEIKGLKKFNTENVIFMDSMFVGCQVLTELDLSSFNTEKVTDISCMFSGCGKLQKLILGKNFIVKKDKSVIGVDAMGYDIEYRYDGMFFGCDSLECVIKDEQDANLLDALNNTSPHNNFKFYDKNVDDVTESGYYRTDCVDNYKKVK